MKTIKLIILISIISVQTRAQIVKNSFENLSTLEIKLKSAILDDGYIKFDSSISTVINKKLSELDKNHPLYDYECAGDNILLVKTQLDRNSKSSQFIVFSPSCDYGTFYFYDTESNKSIGELHGEQIVVSGNSSIYLSGRMSRNYTSRQKFLFEKNNFKEVIQPYFYVGIKSHTLRPLQIYQEKELINQIAYLPENYEIEVLLTDKVFESELYLVKTSYGLIGWTKLESFQYKAADIPEIFYYGD